MSLKVLVRQPETHSLSIRNAVRISLDLKNYLPVIIRHRYILLGVIRNVEAESYDAAVNQQICEVRDKSKAKTFDQLTATLEQWEI